MSTKKKSYEDYDDPPPSQAEPVREGEDVSGAIEPENAETKEAMRPTCTINELMVGWWHNARDLTLSPDTTGDHFVAFAAERGWALVDATTVPPPP